MHVLVFDLITAKYIYIGIYIQFNGNCMICHTDNKAIGAGNCFRGMTESSGSTRVELCEPTVDLKMSFLSIRGHAYRFMPVYF